MARYTRRTVSGSHRFDASPSVSLASARRRPARPVSKHAKSPPICTPGQRHQSRRVVVTRDLAFEAGLPVTRTAFVDTRLSRCHHSPLGDDLGTAFSPVAGSSDLRSPVVGGRQFGINSANATCQDVSRFSAGQRKRTRPANTACSVAAVHRASIHNSGTRRISRRIDRQRRSVPSLSATPGDRRSGLPSRARRLARTYISVRASSRGIVPRGKSLSGKFMPRRQTMSSHRRGDDNASPRSPLRGKPHCEIGTLGGARAFQHHARRWRKSLPVAGSPGSSVPHLPWSGHRITASKARDIREYRRSLQRMPA